MGSRSGWRGPRGWPSWRGGRLWPTPLAEARKRNLKSKAVRGGPPLLFFPRRIWGRLGLQSPTSGEQATPSVGSRAASEPASPPSEPPQPARGGHRLAGLGQRLALDARPPLA